MKTKALKPKTLLILAMEKDEEKLNKLIKILLNMKSNVEIPLGIINASSGGIIIGFTELIVVEKIDKIIKSFVNTHNIPVYISLSNKILIINDNTYINKDKFNDYILEGRIKTNEIIKHVYIGVLKRDVVNDENEDYIRNFDIIFEYYDEDEDKNIY